jgi:hypothetical protein
MNAFTWVLAAFPLYLLINGKLVDYASLVKPAA